MPHSCISASREGRSCRPRTCFSACRGGKGGTPRRSVSPCREGRGARRAVAFRLSVRVSLSFSHSYTRRPPRVPLLVRPRRRRCFSRSTFFGCSQNSDFLKSSKTHPRNRHPPHTPPRACLRPFASLRDVARRCREVRRKSNVPVRIPMTKICALRTPNASGGKT